jgi:hypothetical protein
MEIEQQDKTIQTYNKYNKHQLELFDYAIKKYEKQRRANSIMIGVTVGSCFLSVSIVSCVLVATLIH